MQDITETDAEFALAVLHEESRRFVEQPLTEAILQSTKALIDRRGLRALDAIQLGSARIIQEAAPAGNSFLLIASDRKLLEAAAAEGMPVWDPAVSSTP